MDSIDLAPLPIGRRLKILRVYAGDSVQGVATRWGMSASYVYRVEAGDADPTPLEVKDVYDRALEVSALRGEQPVAPGSENPEARPDAMADGTGLLERPRARQRKPRSRVDEEQG